MWEEDLKTPIFECSEENEFICHNDRRLLGSGMRGENIKKLQLEKKGLWHYYF